jgi:hypothetical protein
MSWLSRPILILFVAALVNANSSAQIRLATPKATPTPGPDAAAVQRKALEAANIKADDAEALLNYIRSRTLTDENQAKIQSIIRRFQSEDFDERLKASEDAVKFGPSAISPLRQAAENEPDFEIAYRAAECLKRLEKQTSHSNIAAAVVRALTVLKPEEAPKVLLGYLPLADNSEVAELIQTALTSMVLKNDLPNPVILEALKDTNPTRRFVAVHALLTGGPQDRPIRIPAAFERVKATIQAEKEAEFRFKMIEPLLNVAKDKQGIDLLLEVLPTIPRGQLWQAEDYLLQLAGKDAPKVVFGSSSDSLVKARDQWATWWKTASATTDLTKFSYKPRISGNTVLVMVDFRTGNPGYVSILGPDMKEKTRLTGLLGPMDVSFFPNGNMAIAEQNTNRISIRDPKGNHIAHRQIGGRGALFTGQAQSVQVLPDENILVTCRNGIVEMKKDSEEQTMSYLRQNQYDICSAKRLTDGKTMVLVQNGPQFAVFLDAKGKELAEPKLKTANPYYQADIEQTGPDTVLLTEYNQIVEYDLKQNKSIWTKAANQPRSVQRLPNGNTLLVDTPNQSDQATRLVEVAPNGAVVWEYKPTTTDFQIFRGYRR